MRAVSERIPHAQLLGNPLIYLKVLALAAFDTRTLANWSNMITFAEFSLHRGIRRI
jgi:hypothetical protein